MDKSACFLCLSFQLIAACRFLHCLRAPVCTNVCKNLRGIGKQLVEQHSKAVEYIVLGREDIGLSCSVPVKGGVEHCFRIVTVGIEVCPLSLSLEAGSDGIVANLFFFAALRQIVVSVHQVLDDAHHLYNEFPVRILCVAALLQLFRILVKAFNTFFFCPCKRLLIFSLIIDAFCHTADDLYLIYGFHTHAKIFLDKCRINDGSADSHTDGTDLQIRFSSHGRGSHRGTRESQQLFFYVFRNLGVTRFTYIMSVNTECRQALLRMSSQD